MAIVRGRSKKKVFGRKRASFDARIDKIVPNDKHRIPRDIRVGEGGVSTPAVDVNGEKGEKRGSTSRARYGADTILSSLTTVPTVVATTGDELDFRTIESRSRKQLSKKLPSSTFASTKYEKNAPTIGTTSIQATGHSLTEFKVATHKDVSTISRSKDQLDSTKKRLTYGIQEELLDLATSNRDNMTMTLLADKSMSTVSQKDVKAAASRGRIETLIKSQPLRDANTATDKIMNADNQEGASSSRPARSMMCNNSISERKVFGDKTNVGDETQNKDWKSTVSNPTGISKTTEAHTGVPRSKSARKKEQLSMQKSSIERNQERPPRSTCSKFFVPAYGQHENGGYQDQKHFGLIEGMGGGEEEAERESDKPHRGRLMELPGSVMPGMWEAHIRNEAVTKNMHSKIKQEELQDLSLSLRHMSASSTPLEKYYNGEESTPCGLVVSMIDPSFNRISSFIKQGVFTNEEVDFCVDGEEKMLNNSFLSCLLLVAFDDFTSSSDSTNDAEDCSEAMLARCVWPVGERQYDRYHEVHMFGGDNASEATGVLFPCKLDFDYEYYILVSHDAMFRISAIDVIFRKPKAPRVLSEPQVRITESVLSEHRLNAGSGVGEIMERFISQQSLKSDSKEKHKLEYVDDQVAFCVQNLHSMEGVVLKDETFVANKDQHTEQIEPTDSSHLVVNTIHRDRSDNGVPRVDGGIEFGRNQTVGENHSFTDEHDNGDNNPVFVDPTNEDPDGESSIKDHPTNKVQDREQNVNENNAVTNPCIDFKTSHQTLNTADSGIDKSKSGSFVQDEKTRLYSRLSNICRKSAQSCSKTNWCKRNILCTTSITRKRLRRASDTNIHDTSIQVKSPSRKGRRATFPSSSSVVETADFNSVSKKTRAVAVVDLFGETESLFGCPAISNTNNENFFERSNQTKGGDVNFKSEKTEAKFNDADASSKVSRKDDNSIATTPSAVNNKNEYDVFEVNFTREENLEQSGDVLATTSFDDDDNFSMSVPVVGNDTASDLVVMDDAKSRIDVMKEGSEENNPDALNDTFSLKSTFGESFSFGSNDDYPTQFKATPSRSVFMAQPINNVYFGHENDHATLSSSPSTASSFVNESQPFHDHYFGQESAFGAMKDSNSSMPSDLDINSLNNATTCTDSQPFHDHYYGQEKIIGLGYKYQCACHSLRDVCYGLYDDNDSTAQSTIDLASLTSATTNVALYDCFFGQEEFLRDDTNNDVIETEKSVRITRCVVQSQPLFVLVLLAGILTKAY